MCADQAVRNGFSKITVVDPDIVEEQQFPIGCYRCEAGERKIAGIGRYLFEINPNLQYQGLPLTINRANVNQVIEKIIKECGITIVAIDDYTIHAHLCRLLYPHIPTINGRLFENAFLADCCYTLPNRTACISCCIGEGNKQLQGGQGLPLDMVLLPSLMVRIALGIVHIGTPYFSHYQPYVQPNYNYFFLASRPTDMLPLASTIPSFVQLVEVKKRCIVCRRAKERN